MVCIICGAVTTPFVHALFSIKPLRVLGTISYSVYLLHPLILFLTFGLRINISGYGPAPNLDSFHETTLTFFAVYVTAVIFYSCCTYLLVERPMLRLRPKTSG
jgi:peptidoglycan/LPS O-acetylase OafA/YrhL